MMMRICSKLYDLRFSEFVVKGRAGLAIVSLGSGWERGNLG